MGKYDFEFDLFQDDTLSWIAKEIAPDASVLEFGAANGRLTKYLSRQKGCLVDIVEIDSESGTEAAAYARKALLGPAEGDIERYGWTALGTKYDYIVFADVLEHLTDPQNVLKRCGACLKETGRMLVSVPNIAHNSVIIDLINGKFHYNQIGLLDNTHLHFFTRQSFLEMAQGAGWAVIGERAKNIRVGENEIPNSYQDVPKELAKQLRGRDGGDVYQYMFTLAHSQEYLTGRCERLVCLDAGSYYYAEILFENNGSYDYKRSARTYMDPSKGSVSIRLSVADHAKKARFCPMNCSCVIRIREFAAEGADGKRAIGCFVHNGMVIGEDYYFLDAPPCMELELHPEDHAVILSMDVRKYDVADDVLESLCVNFIQKEERIREICADYEAEISRKDRESEEQAQKNREARADYEAQIRAGKQELEEQIQKNREICADYEAQIKRKDQESETRIREICADYEAQIRRKDQESETRIREICKDYEAEIRRKDQEFQSRSLPGAWKRAGKRMIRKLGGTVCRRLPLSCAQKQKIRMHEPSVVSIYGGNEWYPKVKQVCREVSAVIPNYNYARFLQERIDSILFQTYPVKEIIILDDCSTDGSIALIEEKIQHNSSGIPMRLVRNEQNSGSVFSQWQRAFQEAASDFVWIAEADDSSDARFLETVMKSFEDPQVVISYCESLTMDENNVLLMGNLRPWIDLFSTGKWDKDYVRDGRQEVAETMCINNTIANVSSAVIRNGDYYEILEASKAFRLAGDWYAYMNILKQGRIAYHKESYNYHRMQAQGLTLSTTGAEEFDEIVRLQDFAMQNFDIPDPVVQKVYERRERERNRFGL